jgi:hypothetical protein
MTNLTTAAGFATFIITSSDILKSLESYPLSICRCYSFVFDSNSIYYSYQPVPKAKHLEHPQP